MVLFLCSIHGLKSGKTLKEFRGHTSFVNDAKYSADGDMIGTASSDGTVKLWDVRSTECLRTFLPPQVNLVTETVCNNIWFLPHNRDRLLVCNKTSSLYIMSVTGEVRCLMCVSALQAVVEVVVGVVCCSCWQRCPRIWSRQGLLQR